MTFQKGQSGNPGGRPRREWTWAQLFEQAANEKLTSKDGKMTAEAKAFIAKKIVEMAVKGDMQAIKELTSRMDGMPRQDTVTYPGDINDLLDTIDKSDYEQLGREAEKQMVADDASVQNKEQAGQTGDVQAELPPTPPPVTTEVAPLQPNTQS